MSLDNIFEDIIEMSIKDIFINIDTISKIKPNEKFYHNGKFIYLDQSYFPSIKRKITGSNKFSTLRFIKYVITQSFFQLQMLRSNSDTQSIFLYKNLLNRLKTVNLGLENLKLTYESNIDFVNQTNKIINWLNDICKD